MELQTDIRWIQRYANFHKACGRLLEVTEADRYIDDLSELELEGLVQRFEYTFELSWKVLQDLLLFKGYEFMLGPIYIRIVLESFARPPSFQRLRIHVRSQWYNKDGF